MPPNCLHDPDHLIAPECNLRDFCYRVSPWSFMEILDAASAEISYQRVAHRKRTGNSTPRSGSRLRQYCDDLQELVRILVNGHVSEHARSEFIDDLRPLMVAVLRQVRFNGNVEEVFKEEAALARHPAKPGEVRNGR